MTSGSTLSAARRSRTLDALESETFDCAIVGGGITGAGIARQAALRGLRTALLEAHDFASGTSSRSSKLIHGGLRYLAQGEVRLVRETALERKQIRRLAPHLAERRWMVVPARSRPSVLKLRVAIGAYEKLGAVEPEDLHRNWNASDLEREEPALDRATYPYACAYREYLTDDARLVLANLRAAAASGAEILNHAAVDAVSLEAGRASGVEAVCRLTGRRIRVRARVVVNAAGPWVDAIRRLEDPDTQALLYLSKGIHVVLPRERLPLHHMWVLGAQDRRSVFAIPRGDIVYVGTTDTTWLGGSTVWPEITLEDVEYLLEPLARYFSIDPITPGDCLAAWAGLRPLISQPGKDPTEISRRDEILVGAAGVVSIAGGKLTGYRPTAERAVEQVCQLLPGAPPALRVEEPPLPGGDYDADDAALVASLVRRFAVPQETAVRLARLYGCEAPAVLELGTAPLVPGARVLVGEIDWGVLHEGAARVEDILYRRTRAALYQPRVSRAIAEPIAKRMADLLGWDEERRAEQLCETLDRLDADLAFTS